MHVQITLQGFEVEPVLSLGTKRNCVSRLVASSISTNKVQAAPRPSNQRSGSVRGSSRAGDVAGGRSVAAYARAKPVRDHPPAKGLATGHDRVLFKQDLGRQCWSKVGILRSNQLDRVLANPRNGTVVR